jgi:hypothetical protein
LMVSNNKRDAELPPHPVTMVALCSFIRGPFPSVRASATGWKG